MLSRHTNAILRYAFRRITPKCNALSSDTSAETERDPAPLFFDKEVQQLLRTLTRVNYEKLCRPRMDGIKRTPPTYKFLTNEQLEEAIEQAKQRVEKQLQMPPVVKTRKEIDVVLSKDPALQGYATTKFVFTDITYGSTDRSRIIVVRDEDGTLRYATWDERHRMNSIYLPVEGREITTPKMFQEEHLSNLLQSKEYEFILNRACMQFDPDDPQYQRITQAVYQCINNSRDFDILRSTRHFGPMVFHLVWTKNIDDLLDDIIEEEKIDEATSLIHLFHKIHPTAKSAVEKCDDTDNIKFIKHFVELDAVMSIKLHRTIEKYENMAKEKAQIAEGIRQAHGRA